MRALIATHHGSTVALIDSGVLGGSIPTPSSNESAVLFSYARGNHFGHDVKKAYPYYKDAGYRLCDATAILNPWEDTIEVTCFKNRRWASDNMLMSTQIQASEVQQTTAAVREIWPGLLASSIPSRQWTRQRQHRSNAPSSQVKEG